MNHFQLFGRECIYKKQFHYDRSMFCRNIIFRTERKCVCVLYMTCIGYSNKVHHSRGPPLCKSFPYDRHMPHYGTCRTTSSRRNMDGRQRSKIDRIIGHACLCSSNINAHKHSVVVQCWSGHCMQCCLQRHEPRCPNICRVWIR